MPIAAPRREGNEAERRQQELEALHALSQAVAEAVSLESVVTEALRVLIAWGWFSCGEGWVHAEGPLGPTAVACFCPEPLVSGCRRRPDRRDAARALAGAAPRAPEGWRLIPIGGTVLFALRGGASASASYLAGVTEIVAAALKRSQLHQRLAEKEEQRARLIRSLLAAQEEERSRIARDLHDQIGQALTAMLLGLERSLERPDPVALGELRDLATVTLSDVRRIALDLRPSVLDELGLEAAVTRFVRELQGRYGLAVHVLFTLPMRLPAQEETVLYRVTQEALTNVVRHAGASEASVVATLRRGWVHLVVEDDGVGFEPLGLRPEEQIGIIGMRERVELLGGSLRIESEPGGGCGVHARLPLR